MDHARKRAEGRIRRHKHVRKNVTGTAERPRLNVFRSHKHIYAQVIDDIAGHTLAAASTIDSALRDELDDKSKLERAAEVGKLVAERAKDAGVTQVVFDRGGYQYHGRVRALAEAARKAGLEF